ncbi:hypothetical protein [Sinomonas sp. ASV322]|uniref:hypothetical protein n=1 Tax=Sinomonas sp. ASV322 TaxID=3041920 RepID=UPI0027DB9288|nr:hypothetical protein [Sinomonas sp. ASV322]MDQ4501615.1 hypothetical protein [Sinomonas sp. ASV322]
MGVRSYTAGDLWHASQTLTEAFDRDPFAQWLFPESDARRESMSATFTSLLTSPPTGSIIEVTDDLDGVAVWLEPGHPLSIEPPPHANTAVARIFAEIAAAAPAGSFWYLHFIGARHANRGAGSALLRHRHAEIGGTASALWTGAERNLEFYRKSGYVEKSRHTAGGATAWWLSRQLA